MALSLIEQVRMNIQDVDPAFPFLSDAEIEYLLEKNENNVDKASIEAARIVLFKLAMQPDEVVDVFSIKGSKAAEQYRLALQMYINNPNLNPLGKDLTIYVGGISKSDMCKNDMNCDNNIVRQPNRDIPMRDTFVTFNPWPKIGCF